MYRVIVRAVARRAFRQLSAGDLDHFLRVFGPDSRFCFMGDHELGGERIGLEQIRPLFELMLERFRAFRIDPTTIVVNGWPWATIVATRFRVSARLSDGSPYCNEGMQLLRLRWGKVVEDRIYEDTVVLSQALEMAAT